MMASFLGKKTGKNKRLTLNQCLYMSVPQVRRKGLLKNEDTSLSNLVGKGNTCMLLNSHLNFFSHLTLTFRQNHQVTSYLLQCYDDSLTQITFATGVYQRMKRHSCFSYLQMDKLLLDDKRFQINPLPVSDFTLGNTIHVIFLSDFHLEMAKIQLYGSKISA